MRGTCHVSPGRRGSQASLRTSPILTTTEKGAPARDRQYKDLRKQYFGAGAYEFSEGSLVAYAQRANNANKADEDAGRASAGLEYFPLSSRTFVGPSRPAKRTTKRRDQEKEKAVQLDSQNAKTGRSWINERGAAELPPSRARGSPGPPSL